MRRNLALRSRSNSRLSSSKAMKMELPAVAPASRQASAKGTSDAYPDRIEEWAALRLSSGSRSYFPEHSASSISTSSAI